MSSEVKLPVKDKFILPQDIIYLDGNSLGPLVKGVDQAIARSVRDEWGKDLIKSWNVHNWMSKPVSVADKIGGLIGAPAGSMVLGDTLSIKVYQALAAALAMRPERKVILSDNGNFPTDLYMAQGLIKQLDRDYELRIVSPENVLAEINDECAAVMLTHVDYRTGRMHGMDEVTKKAHGEGAVMIWDLAHSAGAVPVDLAGSRCEFAVGCTYKYLNSGPGGPAFIYARPDLIEAIDPVLSGWLGHDAPFEFDLDYRPAPSVERFRVGTPPIVQIAALEEALSVWNSFEMEEIRDASIGLSELFITEVERRVPELVLASPRKAVERGSQVSFAFDHAYAAMQALIANGVIGDFRAPDIMRFGLTPLYIDKADILKAVEILERVIKERLWDVPEFKQKNRVT